jgi:hypothetical protein
MNRLPSIPRQMNNKGFALVAAMSMLVILAMLLLGYNALSSVEIASSASNVNATTGYFAAEGGLNTRWRSLRVKLDGYGFPSGTTSTSCHSPVSPGQNVDAGSGDYVCQTDTLQNRTVTTSVAPLNGGQPREAVVTSGVFAGLSSYEMAYQITSQARNAKGEVESSLNMLAKAQLIPMFQFAAFFGKDLEIAPGRSMRLNGRVHTNADLYLSTLVSLTINGQVSSSGNIFHGRKAGDAEVTRDCDNNKVYLRSGTSSTGASTFTTLQNNPILCEALEASNISAFNNFVRKGIPELKLPTP